jgi:hypothetical protein
MAGIAASVTASGAVEIAVYSGGPGGTAPYVVSLPLRPSSGGAAGAGAGAGWQAEVEGEGGLPRQLRDMGVGLGVGVGVGGGSSRRCVNQVHSGLRRREHSANQGH